MHLQTLDTVLGVAVAQLESDAPEVVRAALCALRRLRGSENAAAAERLLDDETRTAVRCVDADTYVGVAH